MKESLYYNGPDEGRQNGISSQKAPQAHGEEEA